MSRNLRAARRPRLTTFIPRLTSLEDRTLLATLDVNPAGGTGVYTTIQAAVMAATSGDTIQIHPAKYMEQVTIDKSLTMQGTGTGVIIQAPTTLTPDLGEAPVVEIKGGATVNINNLTIEGPAPLQNVPSIGEVAIDGIYVVVGATANVTGVTINNIRAEPLTGNQGGGEVFSSATQARARWGTPQLPTAPSRTTTKMASRPGGTARPSPLRAPRSPA